MKALKTIVTLCLALPILASCTKVISLDLGNDTGKLVIEGNVVNTNGPQTIKLSQNVSVYATNSYPAVSGAQVIVADQVGHNYTFTEGSTAGTYTNNSLVGLVGNTYTMTVVTGGKTYQASSTMPSVVTLDSLTYKDDPLNTSKHKKVLTVHYQDPAGVVNQYRFVIWLNKVQVKTVYAYNDNFNEGRYVHLDLRVSDSSDSNYGIYPGDTVTVEMQCIDTPIYTYWYTLKQQSANGAGGGVTPADPPSNITPTVLGYFSAHTTQSQTVVIK